MRLTAKEQLFIDYYLGEANGIAVNAAEMAGYKADSRVYLRKIASDILKRPQIRAAIESRLDEFAMSQREVLAELTKVAKIPADDDPRQVKNKVSALAILAKYHGLLIDRVDHTTKGQPLTFAALAELAVNDQSGSGKNNP